MQDFTGVPAVVDLAAMRDAIGEMGGDPSKINPLVPAELVIDHSVQVDVFGTRSRSSATPSSSSSATRSGTRSCAGARAPSTTSASSRPTPGSSTRSTSSTSRGWCSSTTSAGLAYPDTLVGTDSHTTMINGLGVLGWGVGGIEAEAAMLGQPMSMLIPQVIGFKLTGALQEGATATDLVLTVTEMLRENGVVGKFVEFYGAGLASLPLADRATIGNMSPEFGSTCAIFPIDAETLRYLEFSGRPKEQIELVEAYAKEQGMWHDERLRGADLQRRPRARPGHSRAEHRRTQAPPGPRLADGVQGRIPDRARGLRPRRGQRRPRTRRWRSASRQRSGVDPRAQRRRPRAARRDGRGAGRRSLRPPTPVTLADGTETELDHGHVVIAAITSCTNTSNPSVMLGAGILARNAVQRGLKVKPWVKTSLAPGSKVVTEYLDRAGLTEYLEALGFNLVGYGCTTCIGNSGPLPEEISDVVEAEDLAVVSVLSGNRNFEGRINPDVKMNYLASPPLCVAYALAGTMDIDLYDEPLGEDDARRAGVPQGHLADRGRRSPRRSRRRSSRTCSARATARCSTATSAGTRSRCRPATASVGRRVDVRPPAAVLRGPAAPSPSRSRTSRARACSRCSATASPPTTSPRPARSSATAPPAQYLIEHGVEPKDFNSYGSRRGNHEVMMRGTFANIRLRNQLAPGTEGGVTLHLEPEEPRCRSTTRRCDTSTTASPLVVLAGKEYGSGSSRDWAAKGTRLLGVRAVIAQSFERIHRSNLVGMGVLPLQFADGESVESLGLTGHETFTIAGLAGGRRDPARADRQAPTIRSSRSRCGSTRRRSSATSATAESFSSSSGSCCRSDTRERLAIGRIGFGAGAST